MHFHRVLLLSLLLFFPHEVGAQQQDIFKLFGAAVRSGMAAAAGADWERLPNAEVACIDRSLRENGSSVNDIVRQGVSPFDDRIAGFRSACRDQPGHAGPSFDCRKATFADEIRICADPELARLDRLVAGGYHFLLERFGQGPARAIAAPLLASRRACGADAGCIKNAQISAIRELQRHGAPIASAEAAPIPDLPYVVDGLRLGGRVALGSPSYLDYRCNPSEQFTGFTWCQKRRPETAPRGPYVSTSTILHSGDGTALYVNRFLEPAFFSGNEAADDVRRLAIKYGEPRYVTAAPAANAPRTLMATWGEVVLQPLDRARLADLAAGREVRAGILIDHIGNFQRSAAMGLPVYRLTGGAGYVWAASWDQAGRGTLRFLAIDPSRLNPDIPEPLNGPDVADGGSIKPQNGAAAAINKSSNAARQPPASEVLARTEPGPPPAAAVAVTNGPATDAKATATDNASAAATSGPAAAQPGPPRSNSDVSRPAQTTDARPVAMAASEPAPPAPDLSKLGPAANLSPCTICGGARHGSGADRKARR